MKPNPHYRPFVPETSEQYAARMAIRTERERCARIAWEFARGIREPTGISGQQGDDICAAINEKDEPMLGWDKLSELKG